MCNYAWVPFSSQVKSKHEKLADYQLIASYPDYWHYRAVCGNFMLTNIICDFFDSKMAMLLTVLCWLILVIICKNSAAAKLSWLERRARDRKVAGLIPVLGNTYWATRISHSRIGQHVFASSGKTLNTNFPTGS